MSASTSAMRQSRVGRGAALARLALRIGGRYVARSPRLLFASVERRGELRHDLALRSSDEVAEELGSMKGVLMKLGQMASYIYEDMPLTFRKAMSRLQHRAPPMTAALASSVIVDELGDVPERVFAEWDPLPIAAASIAPPSPASTPARWWTSWASASRRRSTTCARRTARSCSRAITTATPRSGCRTCSRS